MWAQLGMAALNSAQNEQNRMNDLASNAIKSKYGAWTGEQADWSSQGKQSGAKTMTQGLMGGMLQDREDAKAAMEEKRYNDWMKLQEEMRQEKASAGVSRSPAVIPGGNNVPASIPATPSMTPMQGAQGFSGGPIAPNAPFSFPVQGAPAQIPYAPTTEQDLLKASNPWLSMAQNYQPQGPQQGINSVNGINRLAMGY